MKVLIEKIFIFLCECCRNKSSLNKLNFQREAYNFQHTKKWMWKMKIKSQTTAGNLSLMNYIFTLFTSTYSLDIKAEKSAKSIFRKRHKRFINSLTYPRLFICFWIHKYQMCCGQIKRSDNWIFTVVSINHSDILDLMEENFSALIYLFTMSFIDKKEGKLPY